MRVIGCEKCLVIIGCLTNKVLTCKSCVSFHYCKGRKTEQPHIWGVCEECSLEELCENHDIIDAPHQEEVRT